MIPLLDACLNTEDWSRAFQIALEAEPTLREAIHLMEAASFFKREQEGHG